MIRWQSPELGLVPPGHCISVAEDSGMIVTIGLVAIVRDALQGADLEAAGLELELTESILIGDTEAMLAYVSQLKALGLKLSIDDFGTGYSSLSYLQRFQVDKLKIDQSFIRDMDKNPDDSAIVQAIIQMAHSLGLRTIAEGAENEALIAPLRSLGCNEVQGNFLHAAEFEASLHSHPG